LKKDTITKELIKKIIIKDISKYILGIELDDIEFLNEEYQRVESRRADIVVKVKRDYILHLELQSSYDSKMAYRMCRYWLDIRDITKLPIKQYVINFSNKNMKNYIDEFGYNFNMINMKEIDCDTLLNTNSPDAIVLSILCDFKDYNPIDITSKILVKLKNMLKEEEFRKYFLILEEISGLREMKEVVKEAEMRLMDISFEDYPSYELGMEKGFNNGFNNGIQQGEIRGKIKAFYELGFDIKEISKRVNKPEKEIITIIRNK